MEDFQEELASAKKQLRLADHMLAVTFPLLKETKLLLAVVDNLFRAVDHAVSALLRFERYYKRIPAVPSSFEGRLAVLRLRVGKRVGLESEHLRFIQSLKSLVEERKKSPVEFARKGKVVICSSTYALRTLSVGELKKHLSSAKGFIKEVERVVEEHDGVLS
ncbi:hypothetical protein D6783_04695 [Candidatus Woesearchaeota archaeon]|nr:MAG: hypothetical protein D6783_04695 [Candidatus Woesearchaeota archaeon]